VHIIFTVCKQLHRVNFTTLTVTIQNLRHLFLYFKKISNKGTYQMLPMQQLIRFSYYIIYFLLCLSHSQLSIYRPFIDWLLTSSGNDFILIQYENNSNTI
jgi:hypothetical protein